MEGEMKRFATAAAAATAALAAAVPALAADHGTGAAFKVRAAYDAIATPDAACGGLRVAASGSAQGTELGNGSWNDKECAAFTADGIDITGDLTLTAANGDELFVEYHATTPFPDATGAIHPQGTFSIVGGTGRFETATGGGVLSADANVANPATTATLDGTIDVH
jgi:hypothetical protein